jgi:hypothetical protein
VEKELFEAGLGIEEPLHIDEIAFDTREGELHTCKLQAWGTV